MTISIIEKYIDKYNDMVLFIKETNNQLSKKKIRNMNYPSEISENIVKYSLLKKYNVIGNWDTRKGDLMLLNKKIEVKGFSSSGPSSFGPTETWDWLYFIDCCQSMDKIFTIYEIKLSNESIPWRSIVISGERSNKIKTMGLLCDTGRGGVRPHICFESIKRQLGDEHCKMIFKGSIEDLK